MSGPIKDKEASETRQTLEGFDQDLANLTISQDGKKSSPETEKPRTEFKEEGTSSEFGFEATTSEQDSSSGEGTESSTSNGFGQGNFRSEEAGKSSIISNRPGVSDGTLVKAGVRKVTAEEAVALCGLAAPGIWIPYYYMDGGFVKVEGETYGRLRLNKPCKGKKYHQRPKSPYRAYPPFPYFLDFEKGKSLILVEGEFKCLSLVEAGCQAIGLPGFYAYSTDEDGNPVLLPGLKDAITHLQPEKIVFVGDSDTSLNYRFSIAAVNLAKLVAPIPVLLPRLPLNGPKGIDDVREAVSHEQ